MDANSGFDVVIDELYDTGWSSLDSTDCDHLDDGRAYPNPDRVCSEFEQLGYSLNIRYVQLFDCYRAEWTDSAGSPAGAVVGSSEVEAAVYALVQLRRKLKVGVNP